MMTGVARIGVVTKEVVIQVVIGAAIVVEVKEARGD